MPKCKSCGEQLGEAQANASIFALSFLPANGRKQDRAKAIELAEDIWAALPEVLGAPQRPSDQL